FLNIHLPSQERALFDSNALRRHVAGYHRRLPQFHAIGDVHGPLQFTLNHYGFRGDVGLHIPLGPTVRLLLRSSILPSTWPSTYKSSDPDSSPLMTTDLPIRANSPVWGVSMQGLHLPRALVAANPLIVNHPLASSPG